MLCPPWVGYLLIGRWRRLVQNPEKILAPFVTGGMTILEIGPGMGFFTLPLARMVGPEGTIVCVDVQEKMLRSLRRRAIRAGLADRVVTRVCEPASLGVADLKRKFDFALAFAVVHEIPHVAGFFAEVAEALKPGATCLVAEPKLHVSGREFEHTVAVAQKEGFRLMERPTIPGSHSALLAEDRQPKT